MFRPCQFGLISWLRIRGRIQATRTLGIDILEMSYQGQKCPEKEQKGLFWIFVVPCAGFFLNTRPSGSFDVTDTLLRTLPSFSYSTCFRSFLLLSMSKTTQLLCRLEGISRLFSILGRWSTVLDPKVKLPSKTRPADLSLSQWFLIWNI